MKIEETLKAIKETIEQGNEETIKNVIRFCSENVEKNCVIAWAKIGETFYTFSNYEKMFNPEMGGYSCYATILDSNLCPMCRTARIEDTINGATCGGILTIKEWEN